ncbi:hypothetical protein ATANTOWER_030733 [Ataeniobius toweri]|uniref:Ubiquitin-like-conjugating enzyme ATG10 n=1 Tax=Ataeniobius toweri TaxID=208326 RepID=A0ABU7BS42_9TELE|nr:hypothetical protein [Ataeniobius toweri]
MDNGWMMESYCPVGGSNAHFSWSTIHHKNPRRRSSSSRRRRKSDDAIDLSALSDAVCSIYSEEMSCHVLDEEQFCLCCQLFLQRSNQLEDGWRWEAVQGLKEGYLRKTALRSVPTDWGPLHKQEGVGLHSEPETPWDSTGHEKENLDLVASTGPDIPRVDMDEEDDGSYTETNSSSLVLQYEYHILYSCSYGAPVLYFRAFTLG